MERAFIAGLHTSTERWNNVGTCMQPARSAPIGTVDVNLGHDWALEALGLRKLLDLCIAACAMNDLHHSSGLDKQGGCRPGGRWHAWLLSPKLVAGKAQNY